MIFNGASALLRQGALANAKHGFAWDDDRAVAFQGGKEGEACAQGRAS